MEIVKRSAICARCGKEFERKTVNQVLCYAPCQPIYPKNKVLRNADGIRTDCIMFRDKLQAESQTFGSRDIRSQARWKLLEIASAKAAT